MTLHRQPIGLGRRMPLYGTLAGLFIVSVAAVGIGASLDSPRSLMTRQDYVEAGRILSTDSRLTLARCRDLEPSLRSQCRAAAQGEDRVRRAELEARYRGTVESETQLRLARERLRALAGLRAATT